MQYQVKYLLLGLVLCQWAITAWLLVRTPHAEAFPDAPIIDLVPREEGTQVDPIVKGKFDRIHLGMALKEVEAIMGPAGPSLSSQSWREYFIWKSGKAWVSVIVEKDKVTSKHVRPDPMAND